MKFKCIRTCFYAGRHHIEGRDGLEWTGDIVDCPNCEGRGCLKCGNTGRSDPPHHFMPIGEMPTKPEAEGDEVELLRMELDDMGVKYDRRWGVGKLKQELLNAKKDGVRRDKGDKALDKMGL